MDPRIRVTLALIEDDFPHEPSLDALAESVRLSPSRLRHLFKNEVGVPFAQYVKSLRMKKAKQLLETTFFSVKEIMYKVGISNEGHFARDFKKAYGLTPLQYRAQFHRSHASRDDSCGR